MSIWTQVAAVFRVDGFRIDSSQQPDFHRIFGRELRYNDPGEVWNEYNLHPRRFLPCGSEGSLQMSVWENPDKNCLDAYTVSVFGSLRNYEDAEAIRTWFVNCCRKCSIRQAVIDIEVEFMQHVVDRYDPDDPRFQSGFNS